MPHEANRYVGRVTYIVRERGREKTTRLAFEIGVSYKHFKYYILPEIVDVVECIDYDKKANELVWVCDDESEAREHAGPVQG